MIFAFDRSSARGISRGPIPRLAWWTRSPERGSGLLPISPGESGEDILFPFAMCLNTYFSTAWMQPLNLWAYAGTDGLGTPRAPVRLPAAARSEP
jgi:hypothetical protein